VIIEVDDGELRAEAVDGKVSLVAHDVQGSPPAFVSVQLLLSPQTAHNLGPVLGDLAEKAVQQIAAKRIGEIGPGTQDGEG
jgi:hypothetical protein